MTAKKKKILDYFFSIEELILSFIPNDSYMLNKNHIQTLTKKQTKKDNF